MQTTARRNVVFQLLFFRVGVVSLLLITLFFVHLLGPTPEEITSPFSLFVLGLIIVAYGSTLVCGLLLRRGAEPLPLAMGLIATDIVLVSLLVHATGGAESAFVFLYSLSVIMAALAVPARGALVAGLGAATLYVTVALLGHAGILPPVWGQKVFPSATPWHLTARALSINLLAMGAVVLLAYILAAQVRQAGETLAHEQARYFDLQARSEDIIRCLSSGLVTVDLSGRITEFNRAASEITGIPRESALNKNLTEVLPELAELNAREPGLSRVELDVRRPDGTRVPIGVSVSGLTDRAKNLVGLIYSFQNLTDIRRMQQAVQRAARLAAMGQLAATMAHEIRNPLASISGSVELLREIASTEEDRRLVDIVLREVDRLNRLVTEVLEFARPREAERVRLDLAQAIVEALTFFEQGLAPGIVIEKTLTAPLFVMADPGQIRQVLLNLLKNAQEAMPAGGVIRVWLRRDQRTLPEWDAPAPVAVLTVEDQGGGIPEELHSRVFEPFFTTKTHGTGLGLATVSRIVRDHGGTVRVVSGTGGTSLEVCLPETP